MIIHLRCSYFITSSTLSSHCYFSSLHFRWITSARNQKFTRNKLFFTWNMWPQPNHISIPTLIYAASKLFTKVNLTAPTSNWLWIQSYHSARLIANLSLNDPSFPCYLIHNWWKRNRFMPFPCAKMNAPPSVYWSLFSHWYPLLYVHLILAEACQCRPFNSHLEARYCRLVSP